MMISLGRGVKGFKNKFYYMTRVLPQKCIFQTWNTNLWGVGENAGNKERTGNKS